MGLSDVPVLLHGETGVGKEVMARRLWTYSSRSGKPFFKLNCTALPSDLIESELFGYDKGAFTGATADKPGKFELAQNGTLLLDEIGDMDIRLQAKLLQVLQDGEVQPLGSARLIKVNVRVMAATHRDLRAAIAQGSFREDLYYRLSVINITVPPLRERRDEILPLAEKLLLRHMAPGSTPPEIPETLKRAMLAHPWPGNVRELENLMRRLIIYQDTNLLIAELADSVATARRRRATDRIAEVPRTPMNFNHFAEASRTAESKLLIETLESSRWNRRQAAQRLNLDYKALLYKLQKYGIVDAQGEAAGTRRLIPGPVCRRATAAIIRHRFGCQSMFENLREDWQTHDRKLLCQGFWVMVVYRFGRWRYGIRARWLRAPFSGLIQNTEDPRRNSHRHRPSLRSQRSAGVSASTTSEASSSAAMRFLVRTASFEMGSQ